MKRAFRALTLATVCVLVLGGCPQKQWGGGSRPSSAPGCPANPLG